MKLLKYFGIFLAINLSALAIGTVLMNDGPRTDWYLNLNKAPWTPPGWLFGVAWTTIMFCFSYYMAKLYQLTPRKTVTILFVIQFFLNVVWNFVFFNQHLILIGLIIIILLTLVVSMFLFKYKRVMKLHSMTILPYLLWLLVATSLNGYILLYN